MITPRRTRLIRAADLHEFRHVIRSLIAREDPVRLQPASADEGDRDLASDVSLTSEQAIVVPTRAAAVQLGRSLSPGIQPRLVTRDQLYDLLHSRLRNPPPRLNAFEREAIAQAAVDEALREMGDLPFQIRPGLIGEMLRFYDQLRRQSQQVSRFDELICGALSGNSSEDRVAERILFS